MKRRLKKLEAVMLAVVLVSSVFWSPAMVKAEMGEEEFTEDTETKNFTDHLVSEAVNTVQALVEELPGTEELGTMSREEKQEVYEKLQTAYDAYSALSDEEKGLVTGAEIFEKMFAFFNSNGNTLAENTGDFTVTGGTYGVDYEFVDGELRILTDTELTITTNGNPIAQKIKGLTKGLTYNLVFNNLSLNGQDPGNHAEFWGHVNLTILGTNKIDVKGVGLNAGSLTITSNSTGSLDIKGTDSDALWVSGYGSNNANLIVNGGSLTYNYGGINGTISTSGTGTINGKKYEFITSTYLDADGKEQTADNVTVVDGNSITWESGWYAVSSDVTIEERVTVNGDVHLILADGYSLNAENGGINVGENQSLTIYAQIDGTGKLTAEGGETQAGIGSDFNSSGGSITINGGNVTATGNVGGAGIGGGPNGIGGSIAINGGNVTAKGGEHGAGIGGGMNSRGGDITITGGSVNAAGGINSGSGKSYTGIGDGGYASGSGSSTFSTGKNGNAFIITNSISDQSNKNSWSGVIFEGNNGQVYGNPTIQSNVEVPADITLTVPEDMTLTIPDSVTLTNNGTILNYGTIIGTVSGNPPQNFAPIPTVTIDNSKTTASSVTVNELTEQDKYGEAEYSLDGMNWFTGNVFSDLHSSTTYTLYARYKGNNSYLQSEAGTIKVSTSNANYTITIPAEPVEAGNEESKAEIKPADSFDVGYGGQAMVKIKENSGVSKDGKLILTRQNDTEKHIITSILLLDNVAFTDIKQPLATFGEKSDSPVTVSFAQPTESNIPAGTYNGTITFEVSYSE